MYKLIFLFIATIALSGCATYKVALSDYAEVLQSDRITLEKVNKWPEGVHCFEPLMYVLSIGLIPTHCVDTYELLNDGNKLGKVSITSMQGWITLFMVPFPKWKYGFGTETNVQEYIANLGKDKNLTREYTELRTRVYREFRAPYYKCHDEVGSQYYKEMLRQCLDKPRPEQHVNGCDHEAQWETDRYLSLNKETVFSHCDSLKGSKEEFFQMLDAAVKDHGIRKYVNESDK